MYKKVHSYVENGKQLKKKSKELLKIVKNLIVIHEFSIFVELLKI
jgi:hypothetical protein